jgi:hypothetical protein
MYYGIFAQNKNCGVTTAGRYQAATRKQQQRNGVFCAVVPMAAHATMEYIVPPLSNNCIATEKRCFLRGPCRDVISSGVGQSVS